jgi:hypothetical protein
MDTAAMACFAFHRVEMNEVHLLFRAAAKEKKATKMRLAGARRLFACRTKNTRRIPLSSDDPPARSNIP